MKYGFSLIMRGKEARPEAFAAMAERAEALELDSLWCSSHVVVPPRTKSNYPGRPDGQFPPYWFEGYWETFGVLAYLAAKTKRITLGTSVLILPLHNPVEVAQRVAQLDHLSGGRFVFGAGVGWFEEEFDVLGVPFRQRGRRMDEGLEICQALWSQPRPSYQGRDHQFEEVYFFPKPLQKPHPPIWLGGQAPVALRRAARFAACWHPHRPTYQVMQEKVPLLHGYMAELGRKAETMEIAVKNMLRFQDGPPGPGQLPTEGRPQDIIDAIKRYAELGATQFVFDYDPESLAKGLDTMERFAQEIRPKL